MFLPPVVAPLILSHLDQLILRLFIPPSLFTYIVESNGRRLYLFTPPRNKQVPKSGKPLL
jgi:hypothetical protein